MGSPRSGFGYTQCPVCHQSTRGGHDCPARGLAPDPSVLTPTGGRASEEWSAVAARYANDEQWVAGRAEEMVDMLEDLAWQWGGVGHPHCDRHEIAVRCADAVYEAMGCPDEGTGVSDEQWERLAARIMSTAHGRLLTYTSGPWARIVVFDEEVHCLPVGVCVCCDRHPAPGMVNGDGLCPQCATWDADEVLPVFMSVTDGQGFKHSLVLTRPREGEVWTEDDAEAGLWENTVLNALGEYRRAMVAGSRRPPIVYELAARIAASEARHHRREYEDLARQVRENVDDVDARRLILADSRMADEATPRRVWETRVRDVLSRTHGVHVDGHGWVRRADPPPPAGR